MSDRDTKNAADEAAEEAATRAAAILGRRGGHKVNDLYGRDHYRNMGKKGGAANSKNHDRAYFQRIGRLGGLKRSHDDLAKIAKKGGQATMAKGPEYRKELARKGAEGLKKKREMDKKKGDN